MKFIKQLPIREIEFFKTKTYFHLSAHTSTWLVWIRGWIWSRVDLTENYTNFLANSSLGWRTGLQLSLVCNSLVHIWCKKLLNNLIKWGVKLWDYKKVFFLSKKYQRNCDLVILDFQSSNGRWRLVDLNNYSILTNLVIKFKEITV